MTEYKSLIEKINQMAVDIASIKTKIEMLPAPPKQPCQWHDQIRKEFDSHISDHKQIKSDWRSAVIGGGVDIVKTLIVAASGVVIGILFKGGF
jgi:hypothetical protein